MLSEIDLEDNWCKRPLLSIALCSFNGAEYIEKQIHSILNQSFQNFEVVIVDDGSTDGTIEVINKMMATDGRIRLYLNKERLNLNKNFEKAMGLCRGEFICPSDQDDIWFDNKLEILLKHIHHYNVVYSNSRYIDSSDNCLGANLYDDYLNLDFSDPLAFLFFNSIPGHTMMIKREVVQRAIPFPDTMFYDHWLAFVALSSGEIKYISETLQYYRRHETNYTSLLLKNIKKCRSKIKSESILNLEIKLKYLKQNTYEYRAVERVLKSYRSDCILYKVLRVYIFIKNRRRFLLLKRMSVIEQLRFCLKMRKRTIGSSPFV